VSFCQYGPTSCPRGRRGGAAALLQLLLLLLPLLPLRNNKAYNIQANNKAYNIQANNKEARSLQHPHQQQDI
jgi:hypothetical protein